MCHRTRCPNDGKPTWWGCGHHIESALKDVPEQDRCKCEHEPIPYLPFMKRVKTKTKAEADGGKPAEAT